MTINTLLTHANSAGFFNSKGKMLKAVLFTKKSETPNLWLRVADALSSKYDFGEVRMDEDAILCKFGLSAEVLPKIIAVRVVEEGKAENILYEGPNDFEHIAEFLKDAAEGGSQLVELKKQVEFFQREVRGLQHEVAQERETAQAAKAESARIKLAQVGQVEAIRKGIEAELSQAKSNEAAMKNQLEKETNELKETIARLEREKKSLEETLEVERQVRGEKIINLAPESFDTFIQASDRPVKTVLFTKREDTPELWTQLAEKNSYICSFGLIRHTSQALLSRCSVRAENLPRILFYTNNVSHPVAYEGPHRLENIQSFLDDFLQGGQQFVDLRKELQASKDVVEKLQRQLHDDRRSSEKQLEEADKSYKEQVKGLNNTIQSLQRQLKESCAGAGLEVQKVRQELESRCQAAESLVQELSTELVRERQSLQAKISEACARRDATIVKNKHNMAEVNDVMVSIEEELKELEKQAKVCEKVTLKAASAVHVALVRSARENERMHVAMREFIDDLAQSQPILEMHDDGESPIKNDSEGFMGTMAAKYKKFKKKLQSGMEDGNSSDGTDNHVASQVRKAMTFISQKANFPRTWENKPRSPASSVADGDVDKSSGSERRANGDRGANGGRGPNGVNQTEALAWHGLEMRKLNDGNVSDTSGHSHASSERREDDENPSTRKKERKHWSDSEGGEAVKEPSLMHKLKRFGLSDRKEAEAAQDQEQSRRSQLEGRQAMSERMPALVGGKLLLAPTRKGEGEAKHHSKSHKAAASEKDRKGSDKQLERPHRPSRIDDERDLGAWGSHPRPPTAPDPSRIWSSDVAGGGGSDLSEYPWRERDMVAAAAETMAGRSAQTADRAGQAAGRAGNSPHDPPPAPAELGKFNLSRISVREDGREDASARTSALLMDHEAPISTQNATFWNRLF